MSNSEGGVDVFVAARLVMRARGRGWVSEKMKGRVASLWISGAVE